MPFVVVLKESLLQRLKKYPAVPKQLFVQRDMVRTHLESFI